MLREVPSTLRALHANHVGLMDVPPYEAKVNMSKYPVYIKQYPLSKEKGIRPVIDSLLQSGLPDYKLTFHLYVADNGEILSAVQIGRASCRERV